MVQLQLFNQNTHVLGSKILYIVDGKILSESKLKKLDTNKIDSLTVIKDKKEVSKYTKKKYDGEIVIVMKKN